MIPTIAESSYSQAAAVMDEEYAYDGTYVDNWGDTRKGSQLGVTYTKDATEFNIWAPAATGVKVNIYEAGAGNASNACKIGSYTLEKVSSSKEWNGIWTITLLGDWGDLYYDYTIPQQLLIIRTAIKHKHIIFRIHIRLLSVKMESIHILQTLLQYHLKVGITTGTYMLIQQKPILFTG